MADIDGITAQVLLTHMQGMEQRLTEKIEGVETRLNGKIDGVETRLEKRIDGVERKVDMALIQIGNIDERLDDLEVVQVPKLKKAVGMR